MRVKFLRDWTGHYQIGTEAVIGPGGLSRGQFIELKRRGVVEMIDEEPDAYRTAVAVKPKRKRGRPRKVRVDD